MLNFMPIVYIAICLQKVKPFSDENHPSLNGPLAFYNNKALFTRLIIGTCFLFAVKLSK